MPVRFILLASLLLASAATQTQPLWPPKREVRAVWLTTAAGLDWPKTYDRFEQQASLRRMVQYLRSANFNTIFFQVRARGDSYYRSSHEPWAEHLTGSLGRDPGWDPLAFLLDEARASGIQVHAWFNVYKIRGNQSVPRTSPLHPSLAFPNWCVHYDGELWFDPGIPGVRRYLLRVALDLVRRYPVDGIIFDFIRYPGRNFPDGNTYRLLGGSLPLAEWRRSNINRFVTEFYDSATAIRPMLRVGSSPLGVYEGDTYSGYNGSFHSHYQDPREWTRTGKHDYVAPQLYWSFGASRGNPDFATLVRQWNTIIPNRHIYIGIAPYKEEVLQRLPAYIDSARAAGSEGQAFFRFEHITFQRAFGGRYRSPAIVPAMPWKDPVPPLSPGDLAVSEVATNVFLLEWTAPPPAQDGDTARFYTIYRSPSPRIPVHDPRALVSILPAGRTHTLDTVRVPSGLTYYYAVAALDKGYNESLPSEPSTGIVHELLAIRKKVSEVTSLSTSISSTSGTPTLVAYRLARRMNISLQVYRRHGASQDSLLSTLVDGVNDGGTYVLGLGRVSFPTGEYVIRLRTPDTLLEQPVIVGR
ncbi:MAG: family 10 glycosylhydrolase [Bacteroidota bacterium]